MAANFTSVLELVYSFNLINNRTRRNIFQIKIIKLYISHSRRQMFCLFCLHLKYWHPFYQFKFQLKIHTYVCESHLPQSPFSIHIKKWIRKTRKLHLPWFVLTATTSESSSDKFQSASEKLHPFSRTLSVEGNKKEKQKKLYYYDVIPKGVCDTLIAVQLSFVRHSCLYTCRMSES